MKEIKKANWCGTVLWLVDIDLICFIDYWSANSYLNGQFMCLVPLCPLLYFHSANLLFCWLNFLRLTLFCDSLLHLIKLNHKVLVVITSAQSSRLNRSNFSPLQKQRICYSQSLVSYDPLRAKIIYRSATGTKCKLALQNTFVSVRIVTVGHVKTHWCDAYMSRQKSQLAFRV